MERPGITWLSYIYIHVFVCDLAKGTTRDACYTQKKKQGNTRGQLLRERERPVMLGYHIYINLCVSVGL